MIIEQTKVPDSYFEVNITRGSKRRKTINQSHTVEEIPTPNHSLENMPYKVIARIIDFLDEFSLFTLQTVSHKFMGTVFNYFSNLLPRPSSEMQALIARVEKAWVTPKILYEALNILFINDQNLSKNITPFLNQFSKHQAIIILNSFYTFEDKNLFNFILRLKNDLQITDDEFNDKELYKPQKIKEWLSDINNQSRIHKITEINLSNGPNLITIDAIPEEIGLFSGLKSLNITMMRLSKLPSSIAQLSNLTQIYAAYNYFREIPPCLQELKKLEKVVFTGNSITTIPEWLNKKCECDISIPTIILC